MFVVFGSGRHGTTLTKYLLENFIEIEGHGRKGEIFKEKTDIILNNQQMDFFNNYVDVYHKEKTTKRNNKLQFESTELNELKNNNPIWYLKKMNEFKLQKFYMFKFLFYQKKYVDIENILTNFEIYPIIVIRKPIDAYISKQKFINIKKSEEDTTKFSINLNSDDFIKYYNSRRKHYKLLIEKLKEYNYNYIVIDYDKDLKNQNYNRMMKLLKKKIENTFLINLNYNNTIDIGLTKQDKNKKYENAVSNWIEFYREIKIKGYTKQLRNYFIYE